MPATIRALVNTRGSPPPGWLDPPTRSALFGATKLLKDRGLPEVAAFALQRLQPSQQAAPAIVVVGEVKRGKSSLVNALLGHIGLSPVGVDVEASVTHGRFAAWWPSEQPSSENIEMMGPWTYTVTLADGGTRRVAG